MPTAPQLGRLSWCKRATYLLTSQYHRHAASSTHAMADRTTPPVLRVHLPTNYVHCHHHSSLHKAGAFRQSHQNHHLSLQPNGHALRSSAAPCSHHAVLSVCHLWRIFRIRLIMPPPMQLETHVSLPDWQRSSPSVPSLRTCSCDADRPGH